LVYWALLIVQETLLFPIAKLQDIGIIDLLLARPIIPEIFQCKYIATAAIAAVANR
jgi:hypothetical protein